MTSGLWVVPLLWALKPAEIHMYIIVIYIYIYTYFSQGGQPAEWKLCGKVGFNMYFSFVFAHLWDGFRHTNFGGIDK